MNRRRLFTLLGGAAAIATLPRTALAFPTGPIDASHPFIKRLHKANIGVHTWLNGVYQKDAESACVREGWVVRALHDENGDLYVDPIKRPEQIATEKVYGRVVLKTGSYV